MLPHLRPPTRKFFHPPGLFKFDPVSNRVIGSNLFRDPLSDPVVKTSRSHFKKMDQKIEKNLRGIPCFFRIFSHFFIFKFLMFNVGKYLWGTKNEVHI